MSDDFSTVLQQLLDPQRRTEHLAAVQREEERRARERERKERSGQLDEIRNDCLQLPKYVQHAWPHLEPEMILKWGWSLDAIADHLAAVEDGSILRLLMNVPPGFMKSLMSGVFFPSWVWGPKARPGTRTLGSAFKEDHAIRDSGKMRTLVTTDWYRDLWPHVQLKGKGSEDDFTNTREGWRKGRPIKSLTGDRGDFVIIDDPHSVEGAESDADRKKTLRVMRETIPTRLNDPEKSAIIVIMQRIHGDDVSGMILDEKLGYTHLMLPMHFEPKRRCTTSIGFRDPRRYDGELLFPERFPPSAVKRTEAEMTAHSVAGQMQQRPTAREGGLFKRTDFEVVDAFPVQGTRARAWDLAGTQKSQKSPDPDYTVGLHGVRSPDGTFWITDMIRERKSPGAIAKIVKNAATQDGKGCWVRMAQDPGQAGKGQAAQYATLLAGWPLEVLPVSADKELRARPAAAQAEFGHIKIVRADWNKDFFDEVCVFPGSRHDDIVDALSDLIDVLSSKSIFTLDNVG